MTGRAPLNAVKSQVRRRALLLKEFTVDMLVRTTGLNVESVRTELQRMRDEKLVVSAGTARGGSGKPGKPPTLYKVPGFEAMERLQASIEGFAPAAPEHPTSRHFGAALQTLDRLEKGGGKDSPPLLARAAHDLDRAFHAEGGDLASPGVKARLAYERGRLHYLAGESAPAEARFQEARAYFAAAPENGLLPRIDAYLLCLNVRRAAPSPGGPESFLTKARRWREALQAVARRAAEGPLADLLRELARAFGEVLAPVAAFQDARAGREAGPLMAASRPQPAPGPDDDILGEFDLELAEPLCLTQEVGVSGAAAGRLPAEASIEFDLAAPGEPVISEVVAEVPLEDAPPEVRTAPEGAWAGAWSFQDVVASKELPPQTAGDFELREVAAADFADLPPGEKHGPTRLAEETRGEKVARPEKGKG